LRLAFSCLSWLLSPVVLFWIYHLKDPHLLPIRAYESAILIGLCLSLAVAFRFAVRPPLRVMGIGVMLAGAVLVTLAELHFQWQKRELRAGEVRAATEVGRHLLVGYVSIEELKPLVSRGLVGGIFVTRRNLVGKTAAQLREEIAELQQLRIGAGLPPLWVATDQEGGLVSHLSPPLPRRPGLATLLKDQPDADTLRERAERYGAEQGKELAELGVNLNFSPVVDLRSKREASTLDFHSRIDQRAISADPHETAAVALAYSRGLARHGVLSTLKHFPGFADVAGDTHHFSATLETPRAQLEQRDWLPFRQVATQSHALIMLGHVVLETLDPDELVSSSGKVVQGLIRGEWQHQGVLITDDLSMAAAYNRGLCEVAIKGLNAGVDLLLVSYDHEKVYPLLGCLSRALETGELDHENLQQSQQRLINLRDTL
jgi:beta-N-acetylhexosaminidase